MAFVLRGEIDIDGRKGLVTLRSTQREAEKTSRAFDRANRSNSQFVKSLLSINSQAAATSRALIILGRAGGIGLFGAGIIKGGLALGETLTRMGQEAETSGKSLDKAFQSGMKATSAEGVRSSIESITSEIDRLRRKSEEFNLARAIGGAVERFTGIDLGLRQEEALIAAGEQQLQLLKEQLIFRKKLEDTLKAQDLYNKSLDITNDKTKALLKLDFERGGPLTRARKRLGSEQIQLAQEELRQQAQIFSNLKNQKKELESISGISKDDESIRKINLEIRKQEIQLLKAETAFLQAKRKETATVLGGTAAGRQALSAAERKKQRQDEEDARRRENAEVEQRKQEENRKRKAQGLPPLNNADIRRRMAEEAVGLSPIQTPLPVPNQLPSATQGGGASGGLKAEITPEQASMKELVSAFNNLASILKSAPLVTSGAGSN